MYPTSDTIDSPQPAQIDAPSPQYFLDSTIDTNPDDGDWWLDIGSVDLPGSLAA